MYWETIITIFRSSILKCLLVNTISVFFSTFKVVCLSLVVVGPDINISVLSTYKGEYITTDSDARSLISETINVQELILQVGITETTLGTV